MQASYQVCNSSQIVHAKEYLILIYSPVGKQRRMAQRCLQPLQDDVALSSVGAWVRWRSLVTKLSLSLRADTRLQEGAIPQILGEERRD